MYHECSSNLVNLLRRYMFLFCARPRFLRKMKALIIQLGWVSFALKALHCLRNTGNFLRYFLISSSITLVFLPYSMFFFSVDILIVCSISQETYFCLCNSSFLYDVISLMIIITSECKP